MRSFLPTSTPDEEGFTLIELLVVIIIIGILAAIAIPIFLDQRRLAVDAAVQSDVRNTVNDSVTAMVNDPTTDPASVAPTQSSNLGDAERVGIVDSSTQPGEYTVYGYDANGEKYISDASAFVFHSDTGQFTADTADTTGAPSASSSPTPSSDPSSTDSPSPAPTDSPTPTPTPTVTPPTKPSGPYEPNSDQVYVDQYSYDTSDVEAPNSYTGEGLQEVVVWYQNWVAHNPDLQANTTDFANQLQQDLDAAYPDSSSTVSVNPDGSGFTLTRNNADPSQSWEAIIELDGSDSESFFAYAVGEYGGTTWHDLGSTGSTTSGYSGQPAYRYDNTQDAYLPGKIFYYLNGADSWTAIHDIG